MRSSGTYLFSAPPFFFPSVSLNQSYFFLLSLPCHVCCDIFCHAADATWKFILLCPEFLLVNVQSPAWQPELSGCSWYSHAGSQLLRCVSQPSAFTTWRKIQRFNHSSKFKQVIIDATVRFEDFLDLISSILKETRLASRSSCSRRREATLLPCSFIQCIKQDIHLNRRHRLR